MVYKSSKKKDAVAITGLSAASVGDIQYTITPSTVASSETSASSTRDVNIALTNSDGDVHEWFSQTVTSGVSIADSSVGSGAATIPSTTLEFKDGQVNVTVSKTGDWAGGVSQVESITCTGAPSSSGTITIGVTAAGMTGSPHDVEVELDHTTMTTVTLVADAIVVALTADTTFSAFFTADNTAGQVDITAITPSANDATMALSYTDTDTTSATFGSSTATTAGVAKDTNTLTVAEDTIFGNTVSAVTSVETFS